MSGFSIYSFSLVDVMYILSVVLLLINMTLSSSIKIPNIKHLVISGGGAAGFSYYGVLKQTQI